MFIKIGGFLSGLCLIMACQNNPSHPKALNEEETYIYIDTLLVRDTVVLLLQNDDEFILQYPNTTKKISIKEAGIACRVSPELVWTNAHFAKVVTWWSQAQSRYVYLPLRAEGEWVYNDKQVIYDDPATDLIVYLD